MEYVGGRFTNINGRPRIVFASRTQIEKSPDQTDADWHAGGSVSTRSVVTLETRTAGAVAKTTVFVTRPGDETMETGRVPTTTVASMTSSSVPYSSGTPKAGEEGPYRTWIVIGCGLGGLLVVLFFACVGRAIWRRRKSIRANKNRLEEQRVERQRVNDLHYTSATPSLDLAEVPQNDHGRPVNDHGEPFDNHGGPFNNHVRPVDSYVEPVGYHGGPADHYSGHVANHGGHLEHYGGQLNIFGRPVNDHRGLAELPGEVPIELPADSYVSRARATHNTF